MLALMRNRRNLDRPASVEEELCTAAADGARLRNAVGEPARERDALAGERDRTERDELVSAKRAQAQTRAKLR
jgi:hypothetical protein